MSKRASERARRRARERERERRRGREGERERERERERKGERLREREDFIDSVPGAKDVMGSHLPYIGGMRALHPHPVLAASWTFRYASQILASTDLPK